MSVKARALLYAASKLHNPSHDTDKWKKAAKASYDIIKTGWYTLPNIDVDPLYDVNGGNVVLNSSQLIFERRNNDDNAFESRNLPIGFENGNSGNTPTQKPGRCLRNGGRHSVQLGKCQTCIQTILPNAIRVSTKRSFTMKLPSWVPK